jgi:hypothetical protein
MSCQTCQRRIRGVKVIVCDRDGGTRHYHGICAATLHDVPEMTTDGRAVLVRFIDDWNSRGRGVRRPGNPPGHASNTTSAKGERSKRMKRDKDPETRMGNCCGCNTYPLRLFKISGIFRYRCAGCYYKETGQLPPPYWGPEETNLDNETR